MALTPAALRLDATGQACGQSHIARGKTCRKRGAFPTGKAIAAGLVAGGLTALALKGSRKAILGAPAAGRRAAQRAITSAVHRATAPTPSMTLTPRAFNAAKRAAKRSGVTGAMRRTNLTLEALRRRTEPGYRKPRFPDRRDSGMQFYGPTYVDPARRDAPEAGKKYAKTITNPETGRKNKVRYGAKGYRIAPGTDKGDRYCARSFGDMKSEGYDCSGAEKNTPLCLSRAKWKCSGKTSRR